jgi:hypothetical protein
VTGQWFSPVSSTNKTDRHNIAEILMKVALNTIKPNQTTVSEEKIYTNDLQGANSIRSTSN